MIASLARTAAPCLYGSSLEWFGREGGALDKEDLGSRADRPQAIENRLDLFGSGPLTSVLDRTELQHGDGVRARTVGRAVAHEGDRPRNLEELSDPVPGLFVVIVPVPGVGRTVILEHDIGHGTSLECRCPERSPKGAFD